MAKSTKTAIRRHPGNPKLFQFRGQPLVLVTATEHYGAVLNRPFDFERYLADVAAKGITLTRLFTLFREMQFATNPYSTCKPESPDYIAPFPRTGPGLALDGQPKFDLDQWNPEFFDRLRRFLTLASDYGIIVEVTLLSNTYMERMWELQALNPANHIQGTGTIPWADYMSRRHECLFARQSAHVRKIIEETCRFDNVIYEVCNEPGGAASPEAPTVAEVNGWLKALIAVVRATERRLGTRHLIAGEEAFAYTLPDESRRTGPDVFQFADESFDTLGFDVVNMHPVSNMIYRGRYYDLGAFMRGDLRLENLRRYCLDLYREKQPVNLDEDNAAAQYKNTFGWTIHRKRAWTAVFCGAHYDVIDFSINNGLETGTPASQAGLRAWIGHLARFTRTVDLVRSRPREDVLRKTPPHTVGAVLAVPAEDYCVYLADARERDDRGAGEPIKGDLLLNLPRGAYEAACYSPVTGLYSPAVPIRGGQGVRVRLPEFCDDLVVRLRRV